ncbi:MAG: CAP domain-containing protein [Actinobacteria bacterium]|nr:CAP domain-containing protein [Actinomycetota bacterium]
MKSRCGIVIMLVALAALLFASVPAAAPASVSLNTYEQQLLKRINHERTERHLAKLRVNAKLVDSARAHSADMGELQYFDHNSPSGETWSERIVNHGYTREGYKTWKAGENIAWGCGLYSSPVAIVDLWMKSSMHRAVILTKEFRDLGVGAVSCDGYGSVDSMVWFFTLDLGRRAK